jgi:hypothetical protein
MPGSLVCAPIDPSTPGMMCSGAGDTCDATNPVCCGGTSCAHVAGATTACAPVGS